MSRIDVTLNKVAGFVEKLNNEGTEQLVDVALAFGPVMESYLKTNQWVEWTDMVFGDQERILYKVSMAGIYDDTTDFDPYNKKTGGSVVPERVRVHMEERKENAAQWFEEDWKNSAGLQNIGNMLISAVMRGADYYIDSILSGLHKAAADANVTVPAVELDTEGMDITYENGKITYESILTLLFNLRKSGATNDYVDGDFIKTEFIKIAINPKVEELLLAYKKEWQTEVGILSNGNWGGVFRNVSLTVIDEWNGSDYSVIVKTRRSLAGTINPSKDVKYVPKAKQIDRWVDEFNNVFEYGTKIVHDDEVTGIKAPAAAPAPTRAEVKLEQAKADEAYAKEIADLKANLEKAEAEAKTAKAEAKAAKAEIKAAKVANTETNTTN